MADRKIQGSTNDGDDVFRPDEAAPTVGSDSDNPRDNGVSSGSGRRVSGLADRLSEILVGNGDGDLLTQQSQFLQWLQALDFQVMGACRGDERLKPLLKVGASSGAAEDRVLAQLSQHFETSEVGLLARCLCVPLVSIRVGKTVKHGTLLCPTSARGNLNLALLPSSDIRITFVGDDGHTQRLATLSDVSEGSAVGVEEISADQSGRSFLLKIRDGETFYFWCSEKSMLLGADLLSKMKDLLKTKPSLAELTGISESRLDCFAIHLRSSYLVGPNVNKTQANATNLSAPFTDIGPETLEQGPDSISGRQALRSRHNSGQASRGHAQYQGSLSPRSSLFKEGSPGPLSSLRSASKEKLRRLGDLGLPPMDNSDAFPNLSENGKHLEASGSISSSPLSFLESLGKCPSPPPSASSQFPPVSSLSSPYYCWCPLSTAPVSQLPSPLAEPFSLPPLPTFLTSTQIPPLDLTAFPPLEFPAIVSDPLSHFPFSMQGTQQFPTIVPLMCDPIVHIPILDVCSSGGQGYLVSVGPTALATSIPPLHANRVGPMMTESESMVEKGARETLRLLIGSSGYQSSASLMNVFPSVFSEEQKGIVVGGSRGLYTGISDVGAMANRFAAVGLTSISDRLVKISGGGNSDALEQSSSELNLQDSSSFRFEDEENE